jgi:hypothetical protein
VRTPDALAQALLRAVARDYDPAQVAARGARGDWASSAAHLHQVLLAATADRR